MNSTNPWIARFERLNSIETIKAKSQRPAQPLIGLSDDPIEVACDRIEIELKDIFVPTQRSCEILLELVQCALSHSRQHYPSEKVFMQRCYQPELSLEPRMPILLTGLAGTGKSQIGKAFMRLLGAESTIRPDPDHSSFPFIGARRLVVQSKKSIADVMRPLARPTTENGDTRLQGEKLFKDCARWQYMCGVSLLIPDELQFLSQSASANALLAGVILQLTYIGIPLVLIGNYTLFHRLMSRPQEERQRILGRPIVLLPDPPDSKDWHNILTVYETALPGTFSFKFVDQSQVLWSYCAGLKRELTKLLVLSYRQCRRVNKLTVNWTDIEHAYQSYEFAVQRKDIEQLIGQAIDKKMRKLDLWCPLPLTQEITQSYCDALLENRIRRVAAAVAEKAMTAKEHKSKNDLEKSINEKKTRKKATVSPIKRKSKTTAASLLSGADRLK